MTLAAQVASRPSPQELEARFAAQAHAEILAWAVESFGDRLALALSLSVEDTVLLHLVAEAAARRRVVPRVFVLDTGRLHDESYHFLERLRQRYALPIQVFFPQATAVEQLVTLKGPTSFYASIDDRRECCHIRKLEPLGRALAGIDAWVVGLRRAQSTTRDAVERFASDGPGGARLKLSPLAHVTDDEMWRLAAELGAPVHPLHRQGFPSIGCAPCTRAVQPGEHPRAGRWWWEDPAHKECGLHVAPGGRRGG